MNPITRIKVWFICVGCFLGGAATTSLWWGATIFEWWTGKSPLIIFPPLSIIAIIVLLGWSIAWVIVGD